MKDEKIVTIGPFAYIRLNPHEDDPTLQYKHRLYYPKRLLGRFYWVGKGQAL